MGCGSSIAQVMDSRQSIFKPLRLLQFNKQIQGNISLGKMFLFGETKTHRKIIECSIKDNIIKGISNRTRIPFPKITLDPIETLYQQSQQIFHLGLYGFSMLPPFNRMLVLYLQKNVIFLCGGRDYDLFNVKNETFFYSIIDDNQDLNGSILPSNENSHRTLIKSKYSNNKFQKMTGMSKKRYAHTGIYCNLVKSILVFGGRGQNDQYLSSCQSYNILQNGWKDMSPMKIPRANSLCFQYCNKIYVFGGRSKPDKLSKKIQVYSPETNQWEVLKFKLHLGIEQGLVFSVNPNQILIIGGKNHASCSKSVIRVNLQKLTYIWDSETQNQYGCPKGTSINNQIYIFGSQRDQCQRYYNKSWKKNQFIHRKNVQLDDLEEFSFTQESLVVKSSQISLKLQTSISQDEVLFFGNDVFPCLVFYCKVSNMIRIQPVPMTLRLKSNMGIVQIQKNVYFLAGGSDKGQKKPSRACYFYDANSNKAASTVKMVEKKYNFAIIQHQHFLYVFGGYDCVKQKALKSCEKFNLKQEKWQQMRYLSKSRQKAHAQLLGNNKIAILGGEKSTYTIRNIQIYDIIHNTYELLELNFEIPGIILTCYSKKQNKQIIILRKSEDNKIYEIAVAQQTLIKLLESNIMVKRQNNLQTIVVNGPPISLKKEITFAENQIINSNNNQSEQSSQQYHHVPMEKIVVIKPRAIQINKKRYHTVEEEEEDDSFQIQNIVLENNVMIQSHRSGKFILENKGDKGGQKQMNIQEEASFELRTNSLEASISKLHCSSERSPKIQQKQDGKHFEQNKDIGKKKQNLTNRNYNIIKRQNFIYYLNEDYIVIEDIVSGKIKQKKIFSLQKIKLSQLS